MRSGAVGMGHVFVDFIDESVLRPSRTGQALAKLKRHVVVERTGVCLLVRDTQLGQEIDNYAGFDLKLASQLIDANFTHTVAPWRLIQHRQGIRWIALLGPKPYFGSGLSLSAIVTDSISALSSTSTGVISSTAASSSVPLSSAAAASTGSSAGSSPGPSNWT